MNNLLFLSNHPLVLLDTIDSTNNYATKLLKQGNVSDGTVILAQKQTTGRGQRGRIWESEPEKNLTFSLIKKEIDKAPDTIPYLSHSICLAVACWLESRLSAKVALKWPNDVLVGEKKIAGILMESTISGGLLKSLILGIGINLNQIHFNNPRATSFLLESGKPQDLIESLKTLLVELDKGIENWQMGSFKAIHEAYHEKMYRISERQAFKTNTERFEAIVRGVDSDGNLKLELESGEQKTYKNGQIRWIHE